VSPGRPGVVRFPGMSHFVIDLLVCAAGAVGYAIGKPKAETLWGYLFLAGAVAALLQAP
jgi:hypothetical protein